MELDKSLSSELKLDLDVKDGKIIISVTYDGKGLDSTISLAVEGDYFLDKLAAKIPGSIDDLVIAAIKSAMK